MRPQDPAALDALIDTYEHRVGPRNRARVVARAWVDPAYKERLLTDAGQHRPLSWSRRALSELLLPAGDGSIWRVVQPSRRDPERQLD